jgi:hypothetical protein
MHKAFLCLSLILAACSASTGGGSGSGITGSGSGSSRGAAPGTGSTSGGGNTGSFGGGEGATPIISIPDGPPKPPPGATGGAAGSVGTGGAAGTPVIPPMMDQPISVNECPGSLDPAAAQALQSAAGSSGGRLLYPYEGTVFPIGLLPPTLQWSQSGTADAVYVHMKSSLYEYKGCFGSNAKFQLPIPQTAWTPAQQQSKGATDPLNIEITVQSGGTVIGPIKVSLVFALGKLKGDLFYNTYTSPQANLNGAVLKLRLGAAAPQVLLTDTGITPIGPCWSCHSLSANGGFLVAQHHQYPGGPYSSASFDLIANPGLNPPPLVSQPSAMGEMGLGAVYPDGSKVLTMGSPGDSTMNPVFPDAPGNVPAMIGPKPSLLLDGRTGANIPINGWNVQFAKMPSFSPDGSLVAFNWHEDSDGHSIAVANFDTKTNTMSNVRVVYKHDTLYPGWPFITPDNLEVVFVLGNKADYVSGYPGRIDIAASDLWTVDIATKNARALSRANGYLKEGMPTYLPQPARDEHLQFFPTISPIQAGGYFWVFFTSRRTYGNTINDTTNPLGVADTITKKIWVAAYNIRTGDVIQDPSNPPFYLPGQEDAAGNIRAFAALEPCHAEGDSCETGVDCCKGHCYMGKCGTPPPPPPPPPGEPPPPPRCSNIDEACTTAADCCDPNAKCLRYFCGIPAPVR